ncbi:hypothetical protein [Streptomyces sp. NPDC048560]|uniref:hypothetical protein n=1 Tax=Streptomyces sp. NPDC048560 TaxID=3155488 RepID=UPI0034215A36
MNSAGSQASVRVVQTCCAFPSQWDAWTADGQYLHLRYRHGEGRVERHPDPGTDAPDSWNSGLSELLVEWDDGTDGGLISLDAFLAAAGLTLAPGASVS